MSSNNSKYSQEMRDQTAKHILTSGKSATSVAEELDIYTNTVCRWVRDYQRKNNMPSYADERKTSIGRSAEERDLANENKKLKKQLSDEKEKVEILKNPCTSSCNPKNEI